MKQENITLFNVHVAGKMTSQDADALQPLLRTANDDAFAVLMKHRTPKRTFTGYLCWLFLFVSAAYLLFGSSDNNVLNTAAWGVAAVSVLDLILLPSLKKRRYSDYRSILEKHQ